MFVKSLKKVEINSLVIIYKLSDLGNSTFQILKNIFDLFSRNINIHLYSEKIFLDYNNSSLQIDILKEIHKIEQDKINIRLNRTKDTLRRKTKKAGRKSGKKTKSIFDKYKKIIFEELKKNTPKTEILRIIKLNDSLLINTTPQALGQYIKRQQKIKELKKVTKIEPIGGLVLNKQGLYVHKKLI
ncbi:recombinase family protein [Aliarcobacter butzleri]|uniref:recombinase family protein n=1 Tax=Aliarcobacter butzleri TaxID=28197 RepID=UPI0021B5A86C|nr:recombinase family protein [Aliarcobacter butzleri]MCT7650892.1 recombinase family protein [Aliarcobacter butzleri]